MCAKLLVLCLILCGPMDLSPPGSSVHRVLHERILTGVGCRFLLQGFFPTQGSYPHLLHLLHWQAGSLPLVPPGNGLVTKSYPTLVIPWTVACQAHLAGILQARILERVAISFSRGCSRPRNRTRVSCIAGRWFTNWAMSEALKAR